MPSDSNFLLCAYLQYPDFLQYIGIASVRRRWEGRKQVSSPERRNAWFWREGWVMAEITDKTIDNG